MDKGYSVSVAIIVFNRKYLAERMLECLEKVKPERLFVISDGPRDSVQGEDKKVEEVRKVFENIPWKCEVSRCYADKNMGCDTRVPTGLDWVFEHTEEAIILEDDCLPDTQFFSYAAELLEYYRNDSRVMMISGSNQMSAYQMPYSFCFTARVYTWGWATWRRAWKCYREGTEIWNQIHEDGTLKRVYSLRTRYYVEKELNYYIERGKCPWDYQWWISCMAVNGLCIVPKVNLICNEGFGNDATHTRDKGDYKGETFEMQFPMKYPPEVQRDIQFDRYDKGLNPQWKLIRGLRKIYHMIDRKGKKYIE